MSSRPSWHNVPNGTMRAARLSSPGGQNPAACFTLDLNFPKPTLPSADWVLVRVRAAGLNRAELRSRNADTPFLPEFNAFQAEYQESPPEILGEEFVGEVAEPGSNTTFKVGDKVAGWMFGGGKAFNGAYAEYTICRKESLLRISTTLPWNVVGAVPMSMWTAYGSLFVSGDTKIGTTAVVHGATSAVGLWAILLLKNIGCQVIATTRQESKVQCLKLAGADHVLVGEEGSLKRIRDMYPEGVDTFFELISPEYLTTLAFPAMARFGTVIESGILASATTERFALVSIPSTRKMTLYTTEVVDMPLAGKVLQEVLDKVAEGVYKPEWFVDKTFTLAEIGEAHAYMEENRAVGKVVVVV